MSMRSRDCSPDDWRGRKSFNKNSREREALDEGPVDPTEDWEKEPDRLPGVFTGSGCTVNSETVFNESESTVSSETGKKGVFNGSGCTVNSETVFNESECTVSSETGKKEPDRPVRVFNESGCAVSSETVFNESECSVSSETSVGVFNESE